MRKVFRCRTCLERVTKSADVFQHQSDHFVSYVYLDSTPDNRAFFPATVPEVRFDHRLVGRMCFYFADLHTVYKASK